MAKTSFGEMEIILKQNGKISAEFLTFTNPGRPHKHPQYESFFVFSGEGKIHSGEEIYQVSEGSLVTINPNTSHYMIPEGGVMTGLLWYHDSPLNFENQKN